MKALSALKDGYHFRLGNANSSFRFTNWSAKNKPPLPMDNMSFHSEASVEKWKYVFKRRIAIERVEPIRP
jgi:hypothetical protein